MGGILFHASAASNRRVVSAPLSLIPIKTVASYLYARNFLPLRRMLMYEFVRATETSAPNSLTSPFFPKFSTMGCYREQHK